MSIGENIKRIREKKNISQYALAKELGISQQSVAQWELSKTSPRKKTIEKLAKILDVTPNQLFGYENSNTELPELNAKDERDIAKELEKMMNNLDSDSGLSFYGEPLSDESRVILRDTLANTLRTSKALAKKKYTPKKYRKEE
ncbi:helix-turn-helix domain-containing protein [Pectinatus frisingensis]|uniref:helix-turn-helix domain-containing protein n=1 Tax=Pectinatus frisingensis TaxID=865 RepID=UPI003D803B19